jgi:hypothetical protein
MRRARVQPAAPVVVGVGEVDASLVLMGSKPSGLSARLKGLF